MAERRMFAKTIIDSDAFLEMPCSSQCLYFHLAMRADDDGFVNNPKKIQRSVGCGDDDLRILIAKRFIIPFESGVCVIKHWRIHNLIQRDRYKPTVYQDEKAMLGEKQNKSYTLSGPCIQDGNKMYTTCIQPVSKVESQVRLGKVSLGKERLAEGNASAPLLTEDEMTGLSQAYRDGMAAIETSARAMGMPFGETDRVIAEAYMAEYSAEWVLEAMRRAAKGAARTWNYIEAILKRWKAAGGIDSVNARGNCGGSKQGRGEAPGAPGADDGVGSLNIARL